MKKSRALFGLVLALVGSVMVGCQADGPKATADDEKNIKRLAEEGIGAPADSNKPPESTNEAVRPSAGAPSNAPPLTP